MIGTMRAAFDIALRDLIRTVRSFFAVVFAFIMPLMIVGIMYFSLGGLARGEQVVPRIALQVVNLDTPGASPGGEAFVAGDLLVDVLGSEDLGELFAVTVAEDAAAARAAVAAGEAAVAVIIPEDLTSALTAPDAQAAVQMVQDPTLTVAPGIVKAVLTLVLDSLSGTRIAIEVVSAGLEGTANPPDPAVLQEAVTRYATWAREASEALRDGRAPFAVLRSAAAEETADPFAGTIATMTAAMMVVYVFFTGFAAAQSIMTEQQEGTLQRLFMAPVTTGTILVGKIIGTVLTLIVQVVVLMVASSLLFGVRWGAPLPAFLAATALISLGASFGIFVMSLVTKPNQLGAIYGGVMTLTGLLGTYAFFLPLAPGFRRAALFVPQGWAMRAWDLVVNGGGVGRELLVSVGVCLALAAAFLVLGILRFRSRFADGMATVGARRARSSRRGSKRRV